jgi:hypothetical protein
VKRLSAILRPLLLVLATIALTEWVHERFGRSRAIQLPANETLSDLVDTGEESVTEAEFERYIQILESMQADHALAVEPAVERGSMTLEQFRDVERRVQRNDVLVERVRDSLRRKAESLWDSRRADLAKPTRSPAVPDL